MTNKTFITFKNIYNVLFLSQLNINFSSLNLCFSIKMFSPFFFLLFRVDYVDKSFPMNFPFKLFSQQNCF